jgi:hypothetical protein
VKVRQASFALRVVRRRTGDAAILYRRTLNGKQEERLIRVAPISSLAFASGHALIRQAARETAGKPVKLEVGPFIPLDDDWGARVSCFAKVAFGLRDAGRVHRSAENLRTSDGTEAAWWFGLMNRPQGKRAVRALRILTEAVR